MPSHTKPVFDRDWYRCAALFTSQVARCVASLGLHMYRTLEPMGLYPLSTVQHFSFTNFTKCNI